MHGGSHHGSMQTQRAQQAPAPLPDSAMCLHGGNQATRAPDTPAPSAANTIAAPSTAATAVSDMLSDDIELDDDMMGVAPHVASFATRQAIAQAGGARDVPRRQAGARAHAIATAHAQPVSSGTAAGTGRRATDRITVLSVQQGSAHFASPAPQMQPSGANAPDAPSVQSMQPAPAELLQRKPWAQSVKALVESRRQQRIAGEAGKVHAAPRHGAANARQADVEAVGAKRSRVQDSSQPCADQVKQSGGLCVSDIMAFQTFSQHASAGQQPSQACSRGGSAAPRQPSIGPNRSQHSTVSGANAMLLWNSHLVRSCQCA